MTAETSAAPEGYIKTKYVLFGTLALAVAFAAFSGRDHSEAPAVAVPAAAPVAPKNPADVASVPPNDEVHRQALGRPALPPVGVGRQDNPHANLRIDPGVRVPTAKKPAGLLGRTVAELYQQSAALVNQKVRLRGTVVRSTSGIKGLTYLHLRDGSGDPRQGSNDVTVTTSAEVAVGEQVELEGTVRRDVDLGMGYRYDVLVEEAKLLQRTAPPPVAAGMTPGSSPSAGSARSPAQPAN